MKSIKCVDCGAPYETKRANTKRCYLCQIVAFKLWAPQFSAKCWACEKDFNPLLRDHVICGDCRPYGRAEGECGFCHQQGPIVAENLAVCPSCAMDPKNRELFLRALVKKQHATRAEPATASA